MDYQRIIARLNEEADSVDSLPDAPTRCRDGVAAIKYLMAELEKVKAAMRSQDFREKNAGEKCGVSWETWGCDWPDAVADVCVNQKHQIHTLKKRIEDMSASKGQQT